ncbi:hypothetical protein B0J18DRAFT_89120 [Chaetomium sp. MPI-SDFR-AT-0129]|nr:hypothetical protein B0J18DRAFT_89120 [Chaetomium sp. MPI-SDFR-AT-0129]
MLLVPTPQRLLAWRGGCTHTLLPPTPHRSHAANTCTFRPFPFPSRCHPCSAPCRLSAGASLVTHCGRSKLLTLALGTLGKRLDSLQPKRAASLHSGGRPQCSFSCSSPGLFSLSAPPVVPAIASTLTSGPRPSAARELPLLDKKGRSSSRPGATNTSLPARPRPSPVDPPFLPPPLPSAYLFIHPTHFPRWDLVASSSPLPRLQSSHSATHCIGFRHQRRRPRCRPRPACCLLRGIGAADCRGLPSPLPWNRSRPLHKEIKVA